MRLQHANHPRDRRRAGRRIRTATLGGSLAAFLLIGAGMPGAVAAVTWQEQGDAGGLPGGSQLVMGSGSITSISGSLGFRNDRDMYRICLPGGGTFSASTVGSASFDTQLFLFNRSGLGVYADDDTASSLQSKLPAGTALTPQTRGRYYLAISSYNNDPVSAGGLIFPTTPFDVVVGPTEAGGGQPVTGWTNEGVARGTYTITLTGARACGESSS
jgi:hypothetical protein